MSFARKNEKKEVEEELEYEGVLYINSWHGTFSSPSLQTRSSIAIIIIINGIGIGIGVMIDHVSGHVLEF